MNTGGSRHVFRHPRRYVVVVDGKPGACGMWVPDMPGCTSMGDTMADLLTNAQEALQLWAEGDIPILADHLDAAWLGQDFTAVDCIHIHGLFHLRYLGQPLAGCPDGVVVLLADARHYPTKEGLRCGSVTLCRLGRLGGRPDRGADGFAEAGAVGPTNSFSFPDACRPSRPVN